jgi:hypothetical protein
MLPSALGITHHDARFSIWHPVSDEQVTNRVYRDISGVVKAV